MKIDMIMPQMGESIVEGTIVKWRKRVGEAVQKDEMILDISTDKVDSEIPAPASGILAEILAEEGKTIAVKTPIARIAVGEGESVEAAPAAAKSVSEDAVAPQPSASDRSASPFAPPAERDEARIRRFLSPVVKKIAREYGLSENELTLIQGRGENQRITRQDIMDYLARRGGDLPAMPPPAAPPASAPAAGKEAPVAQAPLQAAPPPVSAIPQTPSAAGAGFDQEIIPMDHVRKRIAEHMIVSKHTSAHVTSVAEVDVTGLVQYRESIKKTFEAREGYPITYTAFFIDVAARALKEFPLINASLQQDKIILKKSIHIGIAVGLDDKLIVPVIRHADRLNLTGLARSVNDLAVRARNRQLKPEEVQDGTFSITNIGTFGNLWGTPIINQPQVAILGTGAIKKRPVVIHDAIAIRSMMYLSLTYDHRLIDGLYAGRFLQRIVQLLETMKFE
jgi:2-oxoglutarate dehydrogenase E2 component (dihydrolipoamide succinyltransferase)